VGFLEERADLANRVAVVVGGGGGLGRAIAVDLARAGVHLGLVDRNEQLLADTVGTAERAGVRVFSMAGDGRDPEVLARFFTQTDEAFDRLDILVNVVGGTFRQLFSESNPRGWEALIRTNFYLAVACHPPGYSANTGGRSRWEHHQPDFHRGPPGGSKLRCLCWNEGGSHELRAQPRSGAGLGRHPGQRQCCGYGADGREPPDHGSTGCGRPVGGRGTESSDRSHRYPDGKPRSLRGHRQLRAVLGLRSVEVHHRVDLAS
jgi:short chain dehydrogenase